MGSASKASVVKIVPTKKVLRLASKYYIKGDIRVIPTGIDLTHFYAENFSKEEIISLKNKLGINQERFVFGYIGRTSPEKDIKTLLNAFANLQYKNNAVLLIVGGGPQLEELKQIAKDMQINDKVIFTGFIESEKYRYIIKFVIFF